MFDCVSTIRVRLAWILRGFENVNSSSFYDANCFIKPTSPKPKEVLMKQRYKTTRTVLSPSLLTALCVLFTLAGPAAPTRAGDCGIDWTTTIALVGQDPVVTMSNSASNTQTVMNSNGETITSEANGKKLKSVLVVPGIGTTTWVYECRTDQCQNPCVANVTLTTDDQGIVTKGVLKCTCPAPSATPTLSQWAAISMMLLLLSAGTIVFYGRPARETDVA